ncbi:(E)-4-hydroxy-3-methylbut-2-enyl-diphosphate synthase [Porphyromonadaceae bacterium OttesenSCG-928-L07]|nr:(E)-4-hydroxy-3-methylbut-2-enyl-diphosphate synthase [Porphyromonadaceae bacterium OttesenSCG-928-L07]MDL2251649.1 (E)-4-hydroxy-3-methylbut-2-enyl-diphosphate synthase [Odoribacter sp. OttesenSCG-928-J03]
MRRKTTAVKIGNIIVGGDEPIVIQSMLNTSTMDTEACVEQAIRIIKAGGQLVRITAQGVKEAENLKNIHALLRAKGYDTPLSADIHFSPEAAVVAARYVEKVRINPGNFVDKRATFKELTYTDEEYAEELKHLREKFVSFLNICREHHTAVRIGTNHGSLSDRIMSRYGNTPAGMVEATMEYLRICKEENFNAVVISLKSSDCQVMVDAVRLLVQKMEKEDMHYPLHLGVTEAGEGEDGRIRSAIGIGTLLNEGIGDTIRVSLTEAPENEIPVARQMIEICTPCYKGSDYTLQRVKEKPFVWDDDSLLCTEKFVELTDVEQINAEWMDMVRQMDNGLIVLAPPVPEYQVYRNMIQHLQANGIVNRVVIKATLGSKEDYLRVAAHTGGLFIDRLASALWVYAPELPDAVELGRNILQSAGVCRYKTEFISCPGCGRTLFDLQGAVVKVKAAFSHLKNLKIAVMGCVVNGPGEMGDADYGYVGAGNGKVNLYKGKVMVKAGVREENAVEELAKIIMEAGDI